MALKMKNSKLLVQRIKAETEAIDGVYYTESNMHKSFKGLVIATDDDCGYEVGDKVIYSEFAGEEVSIDNKEFTIIASENVWALEVDDDCKN